NGTSFIDNTNDYFSFSFRLEADHPDAALVAAARRDRYVPVLGLLAPRQMDTYDGTLGRDDFLSLAKSFAHVFAELELYLVDNASILIGRKGGKAARTPVQLSHGKDAFLTGLGICPQAEPRRPDRPGRRRAD
ncbi:MAG: hypothetical protein IIC56_12190, partial [Proteobacteria bacterium]|nr:hypothetical protein [Pseudomonadota bacterium]